MEIGQARFDDVFYRIEKQTRSTSDPMEKFVRHLAHQEDSLLLCTVTGTV